MNTIIHHAFLHIDGFLPLEKLDPVVVGGPVNAPVGALGAWEGGLCCCCPVLPPILLLVLLLVKIRRL